MMTKIALALLIAYAAARGRSAAGGEAEGWPMPGGLRRRRLERSVVPNPDDRKAFDHWYDTDHLPLILSKIGSITQAWRFRSHSDPWVHYAFGEFPDMSELRQATSSEGFSNCRLRPCLGFEGSYADARHHRKGPAS
jgi:hypothetical protein